MNSDQGFKKFTPYSNYGAMFKTVRVFFLFFSAAWIFSTLMLIGIIDDTAKGQIAFLPPMTMGQYVFGLATLTLFLITIKLFAVGSWYGVSSQGLVMSMNGYKSKISFDKIASMVKVEQSEIEEVANSLYVKTIVTNPAVQFSAAFSSMDFIRYCTVPMVQTAIKRGHLILGTSVEMASPYFILLMRKNGRQHLLSPDDIDGFLAYAGQYINLN